MIGIYLIENQINHKKYIGQSIDIKKRLKEHKRALKHNYHRNIHLQRAFDKYGEDCFDFKVLKECNEKYLNYFEIYFIKKYDSYKNGYNLTPGGDFSPSLNPNVAKKISLANKGKELSDEHKRKISLSNKGKKLSDKHKEKLSESHKGKKLSDKHKEKLSEVKNNTGYFRVSIKKNNAYKQGFIYMYRFYDENNQRKYIYSTNLQKLEKKIKEKGLIWKKIH